MMFLLKKQKSSASNKSRGFTIVELLIVIVVIGILATLVIVTFSGIQQKGRDSQRKTDINAVTSHVSAYYAEKGYYPTMADLNNAAWRAINTKGLDPEALKDPKASSANIAAATSATAYGYTASGTGCDNTAASSDTNPCSAFTITATLETGGSYNKQSN
jgi:prepilin-type N-terminal cleavage/methylation domain-containing protein